MKKKSSRRRRIINLDLYFEGNYGFNKAFFDAAKHNRIYLEILCYLFLRLVLLKYKSLELRRGKKNVLSISSIYLH